MSKRNPKTLGVWGPNGTRILAANWRKPEQWHRSARREGVRTTTFPSICDPFEDFEGQMLNSKGEPLWLFEGMPKAGNLSGLPPYTMDDARRELFKLIDATPCLDWLLLTKRPENVLRMWPDCPPCDSSIVCKRGDGIVCPDDTCDREHGIARFRPNVWIGTSVSDQATADQNVPLLLKCRELAPVLFLSCEPLLGTVQFPLPCRDSVLWGGISWVIVGGESGPNRRSVDLAAITGIVDQCCAASCPVFVKQDTALRPGQQGRIPDKYWAFKQFPEVACAR